MAASRLQRGETCGTQVLARPASKVGGKLQTCPLCITEGGVVCLLAVCSRDTVHRWGPGGMQAIAQLCWSCFELLFLHLFCFYKRNSEPWRCTSFSVDSPTGTESSCHTGSGHGGHYPITGIRLKVWYPKFTVCQANAPLKCSFH